jgi:hypothetical protein
MAYSSTMNLGDGAVDLGQIGAPGGYRSIAKDEQGRVESKHSHRHLLAAGVAAVVTFRSW